VDRHRLKSMLISMAVSARLFPNEGWLKIQIALSIRPLEVLKKRVRDRYFVGAHPVGDGRGTRPENHRQRGGLLQKNA
jgi:hypothetical protein